MTDIEKAVAALLERIDALTTDNKYLRRENASLWESVHDRDEKIRELHALLFRSCEEIAP